MYLGNGTWACGTGYAYESTDMTNRLEQKRIAFHHACLDAELTLSDLTKIRNAKKSWWKSILLWIIGI